MRAELIRARGEPSPAAAWADHCAHCCCMPLRHLCPSSLESYKAASSESPAGQLLHPGSDDWSIGLSYTSQCQDVKDNMRRICHACMYDSMVSDTIQCHYHKSSTSAGSALMPALVCRSFLQSLMRHLHVSSGSTQSSSNDAILRLLRQMMMLDVLTVLSPTAPALQGLVDYFVSLLSLR